jgi:hypothetical protein
MKKAHIDIDFDSYYDAIKLCYKDDVWLAEALNNKNTLKELAKPFTGYYTDIAVNNYLITNDVGEFLKYKKPNCMSEGFVNLLFNANSEESKNLIINTVTNKTYQNAVVMKCLIEEYCDKTRDVFYGKIVPFPDSVQETTQGLAKFKIIRENEEIVAMIQNNNLITLALTPWGKKIEEFFDQRAQSKNMCRGYISENELSVQDFEFAKKQLVHLKEVYLPVNIAHTKPNTYKVLYKEKFIAHDRNRDITIDSKGLRVFYIGKMGDS